MNIMEKAEKALEHLRSIVGSAKNHDIQAAAATLGRCLGALGSRPSYSKHYANLLYAALPTLLSLASHESAEVRLAGDEALNRTIVGGFAFHSYKTNILLQNQIDVTKNARWIRAVLSRICLEGYWLRPGHGKIRSQAQTLFPKLSQIVRQTNDIHLMVEALESNLPRILNALAEYTTDEEISDFFKALLDHIESSDPAIRRGISNCIAHLCNHREPLLTNVLEKVFLKLWPLTTEGPVILGWFSVIKAIFQINELHKFAESDLFAVQDYLELYTLCLHYIDQTTTEHNIQNTVIECLTTLLGCSRGQYRKVLLEKHPKVVSLGRQRDRGHRRNISSTSIVSSQTVPSLVSEPREPLELRFSGALHLGSLVQLNTPSLSVEDLSIQTPDSPVSEPDMQITNSDHLSKELTDKLEEIDQSPRDEEHVDNTQTDNAIKINIGSIADDDIPLKYCARLLASKFLLSGNKGCVIHDRCVRVSVKSSALNCLSEILKLYPQAITLYLDKEADLKSHNISGSTENTDSNESNINDFILERNICYQDSLTDSLCQEFFNRSLESQSHLSKKNSKSTDKSIDKSTDKSIDKSTDKSIDSIEQKSSKDAPSNILDKVFKNELIASAMSLDTNMSNSNFTTISNMTGSNDHVSTGYPMSTSGDVLSSSIDLDIKFDHFGESTTNIDLNERKKLHRTEEVTSRNAPELIKKIDTEKIDSDFEFQHLSDVFGLFEKHHDPQIRGLIRVCIGNYLCAVLDLSHGDYSKWINLSHLPGDVYDNIEMEKLVNIILKGLTDEIHSTVNHTLSALVNLFSTLCNFNQSSLLIATLNSLVDVETNKYWLCRVTLCNLYEKIPYQRLFTLCPDYRMRSKYIMETLIRLLADQDQRVRNAASGAISTITPIIFPSKRETPTSMQTKIAQKHSETFVFDSKILSLDLVRHMYFYNDLPEQIKNGVTLENGDGLKMMIADLFWRLISSNCKHFSQGLLKTIQNFTHTYLPYKNFNAYVDQGLLEYCIDSLDSTSCSVITKTVLLDLCCRLYPVEIHNIMQHRTSNRDIFEPETPLEKWQHLDNKKLGQLSDKFMHITLKMLNLLTHLIEEVNPNVNLNKGGIALPGSPVRKKTQENNQKKQGSDSQDQGSLKKKPPAPPNSLKANFSGHFYNEPFYMKLYESLRAVYSNHKINLNPKNSIFHDFLTSVLECLAIQLEFSTEREFGNFTEEILYYLKVIMPFRSDLTVFCVTQLLKTLFGTNMINQYTDFISITDKNPTYKNISFFDDVLMINSMINPEKEVTYSKMDEEKKLLIAMENFSKNKMDKKWNTNKRELERYIRLFEPVVIQSLKTYTMQNDIPLQCKVLCLLNQLLTLRVNYCLLDSDQVFISFLMKQLDLVEQHDIPDCCDLVNGILTFLVQLSSSKHHTKQIIEIPKLIQICDGLMASGAHTECIAGIEPVAVKVFSNMGGSNVLGKTQQQEAQATREVLFYMLQKTMHQPKVLDIVSCVLCLSQDQPESYTRWCELASDTLLNLLSQSSIEIDTFESIKSLERLIDCIYNDVLLDQSRIEVMLKILFKTPPDQATTPFKLKLRYLSITMVLLRKILPLLPESEVLLSINYLKATHISPASIFFNVKPDIDPLNVQNVNENCANLPPDVILVRFLYKTLTYAILELDNCNEIECGNLDFKESELKVENHRLLYAVCVNLIVQVKHLMDTSFYPLTTKTAETLLHNEQSGLNTGMYSPEENIPLDIINLICVRSAPRMALLTVHVKHLLIRLNFLTHKYWQKLIGYGSRSPLVENTKQTSALIQTACAFVYCEYFANAGMSNVVHLTWLLVNRIHILVAQYKEGLIKGLIDLVQENATASGLLLQAIAARCQHCLKDEFALNTYKILSLSHESQSGALLFLICRIIGKLEPAIAVRFVNLAIDRCWKLKNLSFEEITVQLSKEDVQVALELLQRDKVHIRYPSLIVELNSLASTVFDLSPLDLSQDRAINPQYIATTNIDQNWLVNLVKNRCCQSECSQLKFRNYNDYARLLANLSSDDLSTVMACPEFDRRILSSSFKVACDNFSKDFLNAASIFESKQVDREYIRERIDARNEMTSSIDSNKLNISNTIHVFKKSDNKESKSQFFIPINDTNETKDRFGNLQLSDEEPEFNMPEIPELYTMSLSTLDRSLTDVIRMFPKQSRPLSKSENFDLSTEHTIDRYTRRCHQVFQDKLFYQEFITIQTIMTGFLESLQRILILIDDMDCELLDSCMETILPTATAKNIAIFSVISLQYLSFLIKNKKLVESPVHADVSFRVTVTVTDDIVVDHVILLTVENVAKALGVREIWCELNTDNNLNRVQSAISCLYAIVKYLVKDRKPLILKHYLPQDTSPKSDIHIIGDKLITLVEYWETNFYSDNTSEVIEQCYRNPIEALVIALARLDVVSNIALIPPLAWQSVDIGKKDLYKIDLPLQAFQDMDILEAFLFRVNLIGWSSKKQFEEIWMVLLGALQGNGTHWAVRGITALLVSAAPTTRKGALHVPRSRLPVTNGHQLLRNILVGTKSISLFDDVNLERIPLLNDGYNGYHYSQFNVEYLQLAGDTMDIKATSYTKRHVKRVKRNDIDINSCLQLLMDIATDMLEPKANTGIASRSALVWCISHSTAIFSCPAHWLWACSMLCGVQVSSAPLLYGIATCLPPLSSYVLAQELASVPARVSQSLSSSRAAIRVAAIHACLLLLQDQLAAQQLLHIQTAVTTNIANRHKISLYEQSLYWTLLFTLVQLGHPELINLAVDFLLENPYHYCTDLVVRGITSVLRQPVLPKELKNSIIEKLLDNMNNYTEHHAIQILMVHLFSADTKLLSPKLTTDVSNMDPDILMNSMERITLLYKVLRQCKNKESKYIIATTLKYFLRETLPPAATLSRVVIEFIESCKESEKKMAAVLRDRERSVECSVLNAEIVFEVFETSVTQDQLPVLSGWIFEALTHLLNGKLSQELLPFVLLTLLVSATSNKYIRPIHPLIFDLLNSGFYKNVKIHENWGIFKEIISSKTKIAFNDKRLLCIVALKSNFVGSQLERLKELCESNKSLDDLLICLSI